MFSALRALVISPFSYPRADRLVHVWSNEGQPLSTPDFFDILDQAPRSPTSESTRPRRPISAAKTPSSAQRLLHAGRAEGVRRVAGARPLVRAGR